tara:strand:+ start:10412 stop:11146 length:735 start_codon:yes stop_codon:yes gene_type:complete
MIDIIGHRGASEDAPENTLAAIEEAWKQQADGVEVDVRITSDGNLVCIHDNNFLRTTGKDNLIDELSLEEIKKLDAGSWRGKEWTNSAVPTLLEVLNSMPENKKIFIEVKSGIEVKESLINTIQESKISEKMVYIISFNREILSQVKKDLPGIKTNFLISFDQSNILDIDSLNSAILKSNIDGIGAQAHPQLTESFINSITAINKKVHVWTVDQPEQAKLYSRLGLSSITTNRPGEIKTLLLAS